MLTKVYPTFKTLRGPMKSFLDDCQFQKVGSPDAVLPVALWFPTEQHYLVQERRIQLQKRQRTRLYTVRREKSVRIGHNKCCFCGINGTVTKTLCWNLVTCRRIRKLSERAVAVHDAPRLCDCLRCRERQLHDEWGSLCRLGKCQVELNP